MILSCGFRKALEKTLFHFFSGWLGAVAKKRKCVLLAGGVLIFFKAFACRLKVVSYRFCCLKNVCSKP